MKIFGLIILGMLSVTHLSGQEKYITKDGQINFYSHTPIEDIAAVNHEAACIIDAVTGEIFASVRMTAFHFEKALMEEHFNENYVESEKYPRAVFKGKILNHDAVNYKSKGNYPVNVEGEMTIHGETRKVVTDGTIEVSAEDIIAKTKFLLNPEDYEIKIPKVVRNNIAKKLEITVEFNLKPL